MHNLKSILADYRVDGDASSGLKDKSQSVITVINLDKNATYPTAIGELKAEETLTQEA